MISVWKIRPFLLCLVVYVFLFMLFIERVMAAPSGTDLLAACEHSLKNGFQGIKGQMCIWYVTPCDCSYSEKSKVTRVCLPATVATETLVQEVIAGLLKQTELQAEEANVAAALILSQTYPCLD
jgi:hypothetical protein